mmetsp:Transcript_3723/g.6883  ORF Transcript_3723/g.6883 Transcript_3723/m.6883 type:complete len:627 (+) Transcript_3723:443-2323(+)
MVGLFEADVMRVDLELRMHRGIHHTGTGVVVERAPVGLNGNALFLHDRLQPHHEFPTLIRVLDAVGLGQEGVEFFVREAALVPRHTGPVGEVEDHHAQLAVVPVGRAERVGGPVVPEGGAGDDRPRDVEACVAKLRGDGVGGVLAVIIVDRDQFELGIRMAGFLQQCPGALGIEDLRRQLGVFRVDRADVVVFRRNALTVHTEIEADLVVDRHLDGVAHAHVIVGGVVLVRTDHDRCGRDDLALVPADRVEEVDEFADRLVGHVEFVGLGTCEPCGRVLAQVDENDLVEVGVAPVGVAFLAGQGGRDADFVVGDLVGAGAHAVIGRVGADVVTVLDRRRIIGDAGHEGDVGVGVGDAHGVLVHDLDRAFAGDAGVGVDQLTHAGGHGVTFDGAVAETDDVGRDVFGGEGIAVVPHDALTQVQGVDGGVLVGFPAFQQDTFEGAVVVVFDQVFGDPAGHVAHLRPVIGPRVLEGAHFLLNTQRTAHGGRDAVTICHRGARTDHRIGGGGSHAEGGGAHEELAAVEFAGLVLGGVHFGDGMGRQTALGARVGKVFHKSSSPCDVIILFSCRLETTCRGIRDQGWPGSKPTDAISNRVACQRQSSVPSSLAHLRHPPPTKPTLGKDATD